MISALFWNIGNFQYFTIRKGLQLPESDEIEIKWCQVQTGDTFILQVLLIQIGSLPSFDTSTVDLTQRKTPGVVCATSFSILHVLANSTTTQSTCLIFYVFTFLVYTYVYTQLGFLLQKRKLEMDSAWLDTTCQYTFTPKRNNSKHTKCSAHIWPIFLDGDLTLTIIYMRSILTFFWKSILLLQEGEVKTIFCRDFQCIGRYLSKWKGNVDISIWGLPIAIDFALRITFQIPNLQKRKNL